VIVADESLERIVLFNEGAERAFGCTAATGAGAAPGPAAAGVRARRCTTSTCRRSPTRRAPRGAWASGRDPGPRADGSLFDAEASISHLELDGRTYFTAILRDVSDTRARRARAGASEARFRSLAAAAPVGIFQTDAEGVLRLRQRALERDRRHDRAEAAGQGWQRRCTRPTARACAGPGGEPWPSREPFSCASASCIPTAARPG
jgi:PAS domain-containing protein